MNTAHKSRHAAVAQPHWLHGLMNTTLIGKAHLIVKKNSAPVLETCEPESVLKWSTGHHSPRTFRNRVGETFSGMGERKVENGVTYLLVSRNKDHCVRWVAAHSLDLIEGVA